MQCCKLSLKFPKGSGYVFIDICGVFDSIQVRFNYDSLIANVRQQTTKKNSLLTDPLIFSLSRSYALRVRFYSIKRLLTLTIDFSFYDCWHISTIAIYYTWNRLQQVKVERKGERKYFTLPAVSGKERKVKGKKQQNKTKLYIWSEKCLPYKA